MHLNVFIYITINLLLINLIGLDSSLIDQAITSLCILGVLTVGLAHGAIDNVLVIGSDRSKNLRFISYYLLVAGGFIVSWFFLPNFTFLAFLIVSAYHFGQSQFVEYDIPERLLSAFTFISWGLLVLFLSFGFNQQELTSFSTEWLSSISIFPVLIENALHISAFMGMLFAILMLYLYSKGVLKTGNIIQEIYLLGLISVSFYLFDTVIGFSLFFLFIHSLRVIQQEFKFCQTKFKVSNIFSFIKLFLPLTFASLIGIALVMFFTYFLGYEQLIPYVLIIMLSSFTIPHSLVMDRFYQ